MKWFPSSEVLRCSKGKEIVVNKACHEAADGDAGRNITVITVPYRSNRLLHLDKQKSVLLSPSSAPSSLGSWTHRASIAVAGKEAE